MTLQGGVLFPPGNAGDAEPGTQYHLSLMYEHNLQYSSFSLVKGTFGGVKDREFVCVQSVDGALSFFEQGSFAFTRFLPEFLLPGPFAYVSKTDSFVTVNTAFHFESYRFQTLAVATEAAKKPPDDADVILKGKRIVADWSVSIGEEAMDITVADFSNAPTLILVLGALREQLLLCQMKVSSSAAIWGPILRFLLHKLRRAVIFRSEKRKKS